MDFEARKAARVNSDLFSRRRLALNFSQRIETLEFKTTIVAKQLMKSGHLKNERRILIAALNARALAAGTPHRSFGSRVPSFESRVLNFLGRYDKCSTGESIYHLRFTIYGLVRWATTILTNGKRPRPHILFGAVASRYYNGVQQFTPPSQGKNMKFLQAFGLILICFSTVVVAQRAPNGPLRRAQIKDAESLLSQQGFWTGLIDGVFDAGTRSALIAFQKWHGRDATGELTTEELEAIRTSASPRAREFGYEHVEVDLDRQVLMLVSEDGGTKVLPVSTGNNTMFVDEGQESIAYTPRGRFLVYYKEAGWKSGSLGRTYYANFISGGVAIHGSRNIPNEPASHGCIRVPMFAAREVSKLLKLGTIVLVYDKVSFVSAKDWVKNPKLKETALANMVADDADYVIDTVTTKTKSSAAKKPRPRMIRA